MLNQGDWTLQYEIYDPRLDFSPALKDFSLEQFPPYLSLQAAYGQALSHRRPLYLHLAPTLDALCAGLLLHQGWEAAGLTAQIRVRGGTTPKSVAGAWQVSLGLANRADFILETRPAPLSFSVLAYEVLQNPSPKARGLLALGLLSSEAALHSAARPWAEIGLNALRELSLPGLEALMRQRLGGVYVDLTYDEVTGHLIPSLEAFLQAGQADTLLTLLSTEDETLAVTLVLQGESLRQTRAYAVQQILSSARAQLEDDPTWAQFQVVLLANPHWDADFLAPAARRLAQETGRPTALCVLGEDESAEGLAYGGDAPQLLARLAHLFIDFHPFEKTAKFRLHQNHLPLLRRQWSGLVKTTPPPPPEPLRIMAPLPLDAATLEVALALEKNAPYDADYPRPLFLARELTLLSTARFGRYNQHLRWTVASGGRRYQLLWWEGRYLQGPPLHSVLEVVYSLSLGRDKGQLIPQYSLKAWRLLSDPSAIEAKSKPALVDYRQGLNLNALRAQEPKLMIWQEGVSSKEAIGLGLSALEEAPALLIYTAPAHADLLARALRKVQPQRVYLYGQVPPYVGVSAVLEAVYALLRTAQRQTEGETRVSRLAERLAHTPATIKLALEALRPCVSLKWETSNSFRVQNLDAFQAETSPALARAVEETAAYRRFWASAESESLLP
jgi:hypothetical protein